METDLLSLAQAHEGLHQATAGDESIRNKLASKVLRGELEHSLEEQQVDDETANKVNAAGAYCNQTSFRSRWKRIAAAQANLP